MNFRMIKNNNNNKNTITIPTIVLDHQITDGLPQRMMMIVDCACLTQGVGTIRPPRPAEPEWRGPAPPSPSSGPDVK